MILTRSLEGPFRTLVTNATLHLQSDAAREGRGGGGGLRPRERLEAAARTCLLGQTLRRAASLVEDPGLELAP